MEDLTQTAVHTLRTLSIDAIEKANSGHPGLPMGAADFALILWTEFLHYSAKNPTWANRDRFVLSAGHGSMLLYSLLHLTGHDISVEDLKNFRQWESKTPGHPESFRTPGVETTTGPLGQGVGNAIGMAMAAKMMAARFNREDFSPITHRVFALVGDGDMMEGVASEAASLAGHLKLNNLTFLYDDNRITIDGKTDITFTEDVAKRFESYGWQTLRADGHNHEEIRKALKTATASTNKPTLILFRTHIGFGAPNKQDTSKVHGSPLGKTEIELTKKKFNWPLEPTFYVPDEVKKLFAEITRKRESEKSTWDAKFEAWKKQHPELAVQWNEQKSGSTPSLFEELKNDLPAMPEATRSISGSLIQKVAARMPGLVSGSADLVESTKTDIHGSKNISAEDFSGRNIAYGIREHAMGAIMNGFAYYGGFIPVGSTFLTFSDYVRPSIRIAALSKLRSIFVFTHDSIFLGEDGPTHQAVEHVASLRLIPNLTVLRPADSLECLGSWQIAIENIKGPSAIWLTRQKLSAVERDANFEPKNVLRGGYVARGVRITTPDVVILASGSELQLAIGAAKELEIKNFKVRVVSMFSTNVFDKQDAEYRSAVLPKGTYAKVAIEAGVTRGWEKYVGHDGLIIGIDRFGESAPDKVLSEKFGFTVLSVTQKIESHLNNRS